MKSWPGEPLIDEILAGRLVVPETGRVLDTGIRRLVIAPTLAGGADALLREAGIEGRIALVGDENTLPVLGERIARELPQAEVIALEHPKADEETAERLAEYSRHAEALVAVGSGTLNDLCKYVGFRTGRPCAVFATAPSMDGYVTSTVSITRDGFKQSVPAQCPRGVFFDLAILAAAPVRMIRAGLGDTLCRSTAQLDWLLAHFLLDRFYAETPYRWMREDEERLYGMVEELASGATEPVHLLTRLLVLSGLGVLITGTSHCGSMGEHSISHYIDMFADPHPGTLHGEQVGLASWTMVRLQERMLDDPRPPRIGPLSFDLPSLRRRYGRFADRCLRSLEDRPFDADGSRRLQARLEESWPTLRRELCTRMLPVERFAGIMERAGMPFHAAELGIDAEFYRSAVAHAFEIRDRYGFLDLAAQARILDSFAACEA